MPPEGHYEKRRQVSMADILKAQRILNLQISSEKAQEAKKYCDKNQEAPDCVPEEWSAE